MERSHRSHKPEPSVRDNEPEQPSKHGRHENAYQVHARDRSVGNTIKPQALIDRDHRELSGDNEYVRMWLAQMKDEGEGEKKRDANFKTGLDMGHQPGNEGHDFLLSVRKNEEQLLGSYNRPKLKRNRSTDSSLLHAPLKLTEEHEGPDIYDANHAAQTSEAPTASKRHKDETYQDVHSSISGPSQVQVDSKAFEKRARHKTREDRYEPRKQPKRTNPEKPTRKRREKKGDQRKAARKVSESLKDNFNSNKIGQERLTVRSTTGLGIFKNGKASSPTRRRGLPDLAFSEMDFLRRSDRHVPTNDNIGISKSRMKENRKASREQDEIATFFMPPKTPVREVLSTSGAPTSPTSAHATSIYGTQLEMYLDPHHHHPHNDVPRSTYMEERLADLRSNSNQQAIYPLPPESIVQPQYKQNAYETACDTRRSSSEQATTAVSWSESNISPGAVMDSRREEEKRRRLQSSTPDSVRESIERSGVFKNTGINCKTGRRVKQLRKETEPDLNCNRPEHAMPKVASQPKNIAPTSKHGQSSPSKAIHFDANQSNSTPLQSLRKPLPNSLSPRPPEDDTMKQLQQNTLPQGHGEDPTDNGRRVIVEYYDPDCGWYREEEGDRIRQQATSRADTVQQPLTRQQLAQNARVRRSSTTVPVIPGASGVVPSDNHGDLIERTESALANIPSRAEERRGEVAIQDDAGTSNQARTTVLETQRLEAASQTGLQESTSEGHLTRPNRSMPDEYRNVEQEHALEEIPATEMYSTMPADSFQWTHQLQRDDLVHTIPHIQRSPLTRFPSLYVRQLEHGEQEQQPDDFIQTQFYINQEHQVAIERSCEQEIANDETLYQQLLANSADIGGIAPDFVDGMAFEQMGEYHVPELWPDSLDYMNGQQSQFFQPDPYTQWPEEQLGLYASWDELVQDPQRDLECTTDHYQVDPTGDFAFAGFEQSPFLEQRFWRPFQRD